MREMITQARLGQKDLTKHEVYRSAISGNQAIILRPANIFEVSGKRIPLCN